MRGLGTTRRSALHSLALVLAAAVVGCSTPRTPPADDLSPGAGSTITGASPSWAHRFANDGETSFRYDFESAYWSPRDSRALWFAAGDHGVLVLNVTQGSEQRLVGIRDTDGQLLWQRRLADGSPRCQLATDRNIACVVHPWGTGSRSQEVVLVEGRSGHTLGAWELDTDHPVDDFVATPSGISVVTRDLTDLDGKESLALYRIPEDRLDLPAPCHLPISGELTDSASVDFSRNRSETVVEWVDSDGGHGVSFGSSCAGVDVAPEDRATHRIGAGWELQRAAVGYDVVWRLVRPDGRRTDLGEGTPWNVQGPGSSRLGDSTFGFDDWSLDLTAADSVALVRTAPEIYVADRLSDGAAVIQDEHGLRLQPEAPAPPRAIAGFATGAEVATGPHFGVLVGEFTAVIDQDAEVVATFDRLVDPSNEWASWEPVVLSTGFALLSEYGVLQGYRVR